MRSRFNHDGSLDHHAHNEHELLRRADEALERQRSEAHAAKTAEQVTLGSTLSPRNRGPASPLGVGQSPREAMVPKLPHEELAERFALKPPRPQVEPTLAWPPRTKAGVNSNNTARSHGNR